MQSIAVTFRIVTGVLALLLAVPAGRILLAADTSASTSVPMIGDRSAGTSELERQMVDLVNQDRLSPAYLAETGGRALPLVWDERLAEVARARSEDMIARKYFGHVDPDGVTPDVHLTAAGIKWQAMAENIVIRTNVERGEAAFMDEPRFQANHRGAILNSRFTHVGIGIVRAPNGELYITQEFAQLQ